MAIPSDRLRTHIQGLREAKAAFQRLPAITREAMNDATDLTLREIVRGARERLNASPSIQTRALYNNVGFSLNLNNGRGRAGIQRSPAARRAHFIEFGTRHMPAEPFMLPATEAQKAPYLDRCRKAGKVIEQQTAAIGMAGAGRTL